MTPAQAESLALKTLMPPRTECPQCGNDFTPDTGVRFPDDEVCSDACAHARVEEWRREEKYRQ